MAELAHFKNFAKLKDTLVEFNDITVLAGKPGTGKSYVMKFMYAIYKTLDLTKIKFISLHKQLNMQMLEYIKFAENSKNKRPKDIVDAYKRLSKLDLFEKNAFHLLNDVEKLNLEINDLCKNNFKNLLKSVFNDIEQISNSFEMKSKLVNISYNQGNLEHFVINLEKGKNKTSNHPVVYSDFSMYENQFKQEPIFVETPLILEFKKFMNHEKGKTPYHIESLLNVLDTDYSFTDEEQDKFIKSFREKSKAIIGGDIESSGDSFIFNRIDDKNYDILNASSGIKSIGLLQYLVTNKALKKGSVLFWEEPEVHLHPSWQLKIVDLFVELMNAGVKIVFSTHSPFMADYLNAISQRNGYRNRVSFNVLDEKDVVVNNHILDDDNWNILQKELMDSFEDILWQYL